MSLKTHPTAIPNSRKGSDMSHITGNKKINKIANGQQSTSKMNHKRMVIRNLIVVF